MSSPRSPQRIVVAAILGVTILAILGGAVWFVLRGDAEPRDPGEPVAVGHGVEFELTLSRVSLRTIAEEVSREHVEAAAEKVRQAVQDFYLGGFVDPERWEDGAFPDAFAIFEAPAEEKARTELDALTLGTAAAEIEWVDPTKGRTSVVFLLDDQNRPVTAVAGVVFRGVGHLHEGGTVDIANGADLFLRPVDGEWRVFSYTASTTIEPESAGAPSTEPTEGG